jgi:predicted esterase YcpF (UPF0227 family)
MNFLVSAVVSSNNLAGVILTEKESEWPIVYIFAHITKQRSIFIMPKQTDEYLDSKTVSVSFPEYYYTAVVGKSL